MRRTIILLPLALLLVITGNITAQTPHEIPREVWPEFTVNYDPIRKIGLIWAIRKETSDLTEEETL